MYDVIIIGAGVSGIACALHIDKRKKVAIIEKNDCIGKKLALTGNGRCNITNSNYGERFYNNIYNYKFMYSAFSKFDNFSMMELMHKYKITLHEEDNGRMFPTTNSAKTIIDAFYQKLNDVDIILNEEVIHINNNNNFQVQTNKQLYETKKLVIATGGLSYPHTGSDGFGLKVAKQFNHKITKLIASEAPLYSNDVICKDLQGTTLSNVELKYNNKKYGSYNLLITHFGLSGPLALRQCYDIISNQINELTIDFLPHLNDDELYNIIINNDYPTLQKTLSKATVKFHYNINNITDKQISKKQALILVDSFKRYKITLSKYADVSKGFTTGGGIELKEINNTTFESKLIKNLYFIGEVLNIHAHTGGYNITTYFSMGYNCGNNI